MAYSVDTYSGSRTFAVQDGTINDSLDIFLIGKNYAGYGEALNENFVNLLENFAGTVPPSRPINGQIWYDAGARKIKVWDSAIGIWKITGGAEVSTTPPLSLSTGALWWDESNKQLYVYDGSTYVLVGPQGIATLGTTELKSLTVTDNQTPPVSRAILAAYVGGEILYVVSKDAFTLSDDSANLLGLVEGSSSGRAAFDIIKEGITLVNTPNNDGITTTDRIFHGTVSAAKGLVDDSTGEILFASDFIRSNQNLSDFTNVTVRFGDLGYTLGNNEDLEVKIQNDNHVLFKNAVGKIFRFQTTSNSLTYTPLVLDERHVLPGLDNTTDLGSTSFRFRQVWAANLYGNFIGDGSQLTNIQASSISGTINIGNISGTLAVDITGTAENAKKLLVGSNTYRSAAVSAPDNGDPNTIAVRTNAGDLCATVFRGTATAALYADLAEKYLADQEYEVGTVVTIGGAAEVTACQDGDRAFGAVSANPAFKMNDGLVGGTYIALKGRVLIKVEGAVEKGHRLVAGNNGTARTINSIVLKPDTFAIALETNHSPDVKLIECVIL